MCSCHAQLDPDRSSRAGPATAALRHEHDVILRALGILERAADRLARAQPVDEARLQELAQLLGTFADRCHHGKEEGQLFPALQAKGVGGTLAVFLEEHDEGRRFLRVLAGAGPPAERGAAARRYVGLLREHIERENEVLFPMADEVLTLEEHDALARGYEAVEREIVGPGVHEQLLAALDRLEAAFPPEAAAREATP